MLKGNWVPLVCPEFPCVGIKVPHPGKPLCPWPTGMASHPPQDVCMCCVTSQKLKGPLTTEFLLQQNLEKLLGRKAIALSPSWTTKKAECRRIDGFKVWCWRRLLRVLWTARSNQSILKDIDPEYSLEGLMLKLQYFGHLMRRADTLEKTLMLGKMESRRRRGRQRMRWFG